MIRKLLERKKNRIPVVLLVILGLLAFAYFSISAPTVVQLAPNEPIHKITFNTPFSLNFSHPMNKSSVERAFKISPKISGNFVWPDRKTIEFHPTGDMFIGEDFKITIDSKAKSLLGKKIGSEISIKYTVTGPPFVLFISPGRPMEEMQVTSQEEVSEKVDEVEIGDQENIPVITKDQAVTVMFDRPMKFNEMDLDQLLTVQPPLAGQFEIIGMSAFEFKPFNLKQDEIYTFTIPRGIEAVEGGKTEHEIIWQLKPPSLKVLSVGPHQDSNEVGIFDPIVVTFNQPVDLNIIKPGINVLLYPSNDLDANIRLKMDGFFNTEVTHDVDKKGNTDETTLVFKPTFPFLYEQKYRLQLKMDSDLDLMNDYEISFTTPKQPDEDKSDETKQQTNFSDNKILNWKSPEPIETFVHDNKPTLFLKNKVTNPISVALCQLSTEQFIAVNKRQSWHSFLCNDAWASIHPEESGINIISLDEYFDRSWETGIYFISLQSNNEKINKIFFINDTSLLLKKGEEELLVWATDIKSGEPIARMEMTILDYDGKELARGVTDGSGVYKISRPLDTGIYVVGKKYLEGEDRKVLANDLWQLKSDEEKSASQMFYPVYISTNKTVFKPGETLQVKGIWRDKENHLLKLPDVKQVMVVLANKNSEPITEELVPLRRNGSFDTEMVLQKNLEPSDIFIKVYNENQEPLSLSYPIKIQSDDSEITMEWVTKLDHYTQNSIPIIHLKAWHESGMPVSGLKGTWRLYKRPFKKNYEDGGAVHYFFGSQKSHPCDHQSCYKPESLVTTGVFELDLEGVVSFTLANNDDFLLPGYEYQLIADLNLPDNEIVSQSTFFKIHPAAFDIGLGVKHALINLNKTIEASVLALSHNNELLDDKKITLSLISASDKKSETYYEKTIHFQKEPIFIEIPLTKKIDSGKYILKARSKDEHGNEIISECEVYIILDQTDSLDEALAIYADQSKYFVGGRAHLVINNPRATEENPISALVTYEKDGLMGYEVVLLNAPITPITIPIRASMAPHFYANVTTFEKDQYLTDNVELQVINDDQKINIDITYKPVKPKPGEEVTVTFATTDYQNRPIPSVITTNIIKDDIHKLMMPEDYFYKPSPLDIENASNHYFSILEEEKVFFENEAGYLPVANSLFYTPLITTDEGGKATVTFTLPPEKTIWNIVAIATNDASRFGYEISEIKMLERLLIKPILPKYAVPQDQIRVGAFVQNVSDEAINTNIQLLSDDVFFDSDHKKNLSLKRGQGTTIYWDIEIKPTSKNEIQFKFRSREDLISVKLPIRKLPLKEVVLNGGLITDQWEGTFNIPDRIYENLGNLILMLSGSPATLIDRYSYALFDATPLSNELLASQLISFLSKYELSDKQNQEIFDTANMLYSALTYKIKTDGSFSYWETGSKSNPYFTAYILFAFDRAKKAGITVDEVTNNKMARYLWQTLRNENLPLWEKTFVLFALSEAEEYDTSQTLQLFKERDDMSTGTKFYLLLNLHNLYKAGQKSVFSFIEKLKSELADQKVDNENFIRYKENKETPFMTDDQVTALALLAYTRLDEENPSVIPLLRYLSDHITPSLNYVSTLEAVWIMLAIENFVSIQGDFPINYIAKATVNEKTVLDQSITTPLSHKVFSEELSLSDLFSSRANEVIVTKDGVGTLYLDAILSGYENSKELQPKESGMIIMRKLTDENDNLVNILNRGNKYTETIKLIVPKDLSYVQLEDFIPAGMLMLGIISDTKSSSWPFESIKIHDDRITLMAEHLPAGVYQVTFQLIASLPGGYHQLPAMARQIYNPSIYAQTEGEQIVIKKE